MEDFNEDLAKRLNDLLFEDRLSKTGFADKIKVSKGLITQLLDGKASAGGKVFIGIALYMPDVNMNWLFRGNGPMKVNEDEIYESEEEIIGIMKILDAHNARLSRIENRLGFTQDSVQ